MGGAGRHVITITGSRRMSDRRRCTRVARTPAWSVRVGHAGSRRYRCLAWTGCRTAPLPEDVPAAELVDAPDDVAPPLDDAVWKMNRTRPGQLTQNRKTDSNVDVAGRRSA